LALTASFALQIISIGKQLEKNDVFNWLAPQACAHTYLMKFYLKKALAPRPSDRQSALDLYENIFAPGKSCIPTDVLQLLYIPHI